MIVKENQLNLNKYCRIGKIIFPIVLMKRNAINIFWRSTYTVDKIYGCYRNWFKKKKNNTKKKRELKEYRKTLRFAVKWLFVKTDHKDLSIKSAECIGSCYKRINSRVLSKYLHGKALNDKGKHSKKAPARSKKVCYNFFCTYFLALTTHKTTYFYTEKLFCFLCE